MSRNFSDKDPLETVVLSVDFSQVLAQGETILAAVWSVARENGSEDTATMLDGAVDISGAPVVRQRVTGGTDGGTYLHRAKITTSTGRILVHGARQVVRLGA